MSVITEVKCCDCGLNDLHFNIKGANDIKSKGVILQLSFSLHHIYCRCGVFLDLLKSCCTMYNIYSNDTRYTVHNHYLGLILKVRCADRALYVK